MEKKDKKKLPAAKEPQVEKFVPEYYTLASVEDERLSWISSLAWDARTHFGIESVGVDCVQLGKKLNVNATYRITIKTTPLPGDVDAQTIYIPGIDHYYIGLNRNKLRYPFKTSSDYRTNFTIAHELGHILLGHASVPNSQKNDTLQKKEDIEADEFAGQFLMPERFLLRCTFRWPAKVADHFKVSHTALWQRLNNLKRLDLLEDEGKAKRYFRCCDVCGNRDIEFGYDKYCAICGKEVTNDTWGVLPYHYSGPESARYITMICPRCGKNLYHVKGDICPNCDQQRKNSCENNCLSEIRPSDRYCRHCGKRTRYYEDALLTPWWYAMNSGVMVERPKVAKRRIMSE